MALQLPPCPASLKQIQHFLKVGSEHETRDPVVTYWCRLYALQTALKIDKKSDEAKLLLVKLMDWLEMEKKSLSHNESITNDIAAQAHLENYSLKLFIWADGQDRAAVFNKNVVKAFYTAGVLMDVLSTFGELSEDIIANRKYAKWKAAYIHNCLKNGETPIPGPLTYEGEESEAEASGNIGFNVPSVGGTAINNGNENIADKPDIMNQTPTPTGFSDVPSQIPPHSLSQPVLPSLVQDVTNPYSSTTRSDPTPMCVTPSPSPSVSSQGAITETGIKLDPSQINKAQKYCKFAGSALNYDDISDAINYLQKALKILQTGEDS